MIKKSKLLPTIITIGAIIILIAAGVIIGVDKYKKDTVPTNDVSPADTASPDVVQPVATEEPKPEPEPTGPTIEQIAQDYLPFGYELEHQVLQGNFGNWNDAIIFFYKEKDCFQCQYFGKVLVPKNDEYKQLDLPEFNQFDNETVDNIGIAAVMFSNLDRDEENEIIILVEGFKKGPNGWSLYNTAVLDWAYYKFKSMDRWENYFSYKCEESKCIKYMKDGYFNFFGHYYGENEFIAADMQIEMDDNGTFKGNWDAGYGEGHMCIFDFEIDLLNANEGTMYKPGTQHEIADITYKNNQIEVKFLMELEELDCGYGHPDILELKKK